MAKAIYFITTDEANEIVEKWEQNPKVNNNYYIATELHRICAIDNTDGECWTEEFNTLDDAVNWLFDNV